MTNLEIFLLAIFGGLFVALLSGGITYYKEGSPSTKQLSRDFLLGSIVTAFLYPMLPESMDNVKDILTAEATATSSGMIDPGVQVGPANF